MINELQKELDKDRAFINKVQDRIYCELEGFEESIPQHEWIEQITDIAEKYLMRFKAAENMRRKSASDKTKTNDTLQLFRKFVKSTELSARKHLKKQSDYGSYHGGINNTCRDMYAWIDQLERDLNDELE